MWKQVAGLSISLNTLLLLEAMPRHTLKLKWRFGNQTIKPEMPWFTVPPRIIWQWNWWHWEQTVDKTWTSVTPRGAKDKPTKGLNLRFLRKLQHFPLLLVSNPFQPWLVSGKPGGSPLFRRAEGGRMLLPAQMTQRGGICSDSQRITYTPAAGRERGDTGPCELPPPHGRAGREGGGWAPACGRWPLGKWDRRRQPRGRTGPCTSPCKKRLGKLVIKVPSPRKKKGKRGFPPQSLRKRTRTFLL